MTKKNSLKNKVVIFYNIVGKVKIIPDDIYKMYIKKGGIYKKYSKYIRYDPIFIKLVKKDMMGTNFKIVNISEEAVKLDVWNIKNNRGYEKIIIDNEKILEKKYKDLLEEFQELQNKYDYMLKLSCSKYKRSQDESSEESSEESCHESSEESSEESSDELSEELCEESCEEFCEESCEELCEELCEESCDESDEESSGESCEELDKDY